VRNLSANEQRPEPFGPDFLIAIRALVNVHHSIYRKIPPQGIYFESLVEEAFRQIRQPFAVIEPTARNQPTHDLLVEGLRISLKTETGLGTDSEYVHMTKLCTTEREPWEPRVLIARVMEHLSRYDIILTLRAIWETPLIHYQWLEIPVETLRRIEGAQLASVGRRTGRSSLAADVLRGEEKIFRVHFDGSDGKCQISRLRIRHCRMLLEWDFRVRE